MVTYWNRFNKPVFILLTEEKKEEKKEESEESEDDMGFGRFTSLIIFCLNFYVVYVPFPTPT